MKALLLKDLYNLKSYLRVLAAMAVFYLIFGLTSRNSTMFSSIIMMFAVMLPVSLFSYDDYSKWDAYCLSLPVSRRQVVTARYLLALLALAVCGLLSAAVMVEQQRFQPDVESEGGWYALGMIASVAVLYLAVALPLCYKLGVEKGRFLLMALIAVPFVGFLLLSQLGIDPPSEEQMLFWMGAVLPVMAVALLIFSYLLSVYFYQRKEF